MEDVFRFDVESRLHLRRNNFWLRCRHIDLSKYKCKSLQPVLNRHHTNDLIEDRYYFESSFSGDVEYGYGLCLYALS